MTALCSTPALLWLDRCKQCHRHCAMRQLLSGTTKLVLFDIMKQLVTDTNLEMGGHIQQLMILELHISGTKQQIWFWE